MNVEPKAKAKLSLVDLADGEIEDAPDLVPPGEYQLRLRSWWTGILFGRAPKLALRFEIVDIGEHFGKRVCRWYNVRRLIGRGGVSGRFKAGWSSDVVREYVGLVGNAARSDRIALQRYKALVVVGQVETVAATEKQEPLPPELQYSVVRRLVRVEAGKCAA